MGVLFLALIPVDGFFIYFSTYLCYTVVLTHKVLLRGCHKLPFVMLFTIPITFVIAHNFQPFFFPFLAYLSFPILIPLISSFTQDKTETRDDHIGRNELYRKHSTRIYFALLYSGSMMSLQSSPIKSASSEEPQKQNLGMLSATM